MMSSFFSLFPTKSALAAIDSDNDTTFDDVVLKSSVPVLVQFGAIWCSPCQQITPIVEGISKDYAGRIKVVYVDIDESLDSPRKYGVRSVSDLVFFREGSKTNRNVSS